MKIIKHFNLICPETFGLALIILFCLSLSSCQKLVEVDAPENTVSTGNAFKEDETAAAVFNGFYSSLSDRSSSATLNYSLLTGLSSDEFVPGVIDNNTISNFYYNELRSTTVDLPWGFGYKGIFNYNTALEGIGESSTLSTGIKDQLTGQALFLRSLDYFYLAALFGDLPLILTTDYKVNRRLSRTPEMQIYSQLMQDLQKAETLVRPEYVDVDGKTPSGKRITPNRAAVQALLSRVCLYHSDFQLAEQFASKVIEQNDLYSLQKLDEVFLAGSKEIIWQLQPVEASWNTPDGRMFILPSSGPDIDHPVSLNKELIDSFESGDKRKISWTASITAGGKTYFYPTKYKIGIPDQSVTEYKAVLRLGELYLIRAEARARLNNFDGARADINVIRKRAGLDEISPDTQADLLAAISKERRFELFTEWGDRWINLRRTGELNEVMKDASVVKGRVWESYKSLFPIPIEDIRYNLNLKQNLGY